MNNENNNVGFKYVYKMLVANDLMEKGFFCVGTGFNAKSQSFFWKFKHSDVDEYYSKKYKDFNFEK